MVVTMELITTKVVPIEVMVTVVILVVETVTHGSGGGSDDNSGGVVIEVVRGVVVSDGRGLMEVATSRTVGEIRGSGGDPVGGDEVVEVVCYRALLQ